MCITDLSMSFRSWQAPLSTGTYVSVNKDNTVKLKLEAPSERDCGPIIDYLIRDNSTQKNLDSSYSVINGVVEITIIDLMAEKLYTVQVSARNNRWEGPPSDLFTFETSKGMRMVMFMWCCIPRGVSFI